MKFRFLQMFGKPGIIKNTATAYHLGIFRTQEKQIPIQNLEDMEWLKAAASLTAQEFCDT